MTIQIGVVALQAIALRPAELLAAPDRLYLQSPERYEFIDSTDLSKRYVISLQTGLYIPFSGLSGGTSVKVNGVAADGSGNIAVTPSDVRSIAQSIPWDLASNLATAADASTFTPTSGTEPPAGNNNLLATGAGTRTLDGNVYSQGDTALYSAAFGSYIYVAAVDPAIGAESAARTAADATLTAADKVQSTNAQTGTTYTLVLADGGQNVDMSNASANVLTVPPNSSVAFPIGTVISVTQAGAGVTTMAPGAGVTFVKPASRGLGISAQYETALLYKIAINTWRVYCN